ncbi:MAG: AMP-binding protein, partial [Trebonia sp.]
LAGERLDPETYEWISAGLGVPAIDHWWQTETGWAMSANPLGRDILPLKAGSSTVPMPGYDIAILDAKGRPATGDSGHIDEDGYLFVMGRTDDVINVAGHRLSTGAPSKRY